MKWRITGKWNIHCRSRCRRGRMGFVSLRVLSPVVFVPRGAKEHHGTFPNGPTTNPFSFSNHHAATLHPYPWNVSHRSHYPCPLLNLSPPHRHPAPLPPDFCPGSSACTPPPPSPHIRTHKDDDEGTCIHPSPPTPVSPSSFLYPPLPLAVKVREGMPFSFGRFFICVMCVSFAACVSFFLPKSISLSSPPPPEHAVLPHCAHKE